jgi:hypothetical protein
LPVCALVLLEKANKCALGTKCFASCECKAAALAHRVQNPFSETDAQQVLTLLFWIELLSQHSSMISMAQIGFLPLWQTGEQAFLLFVFWNSAADETSVALFGSEVISPPNGPNPLSNRIHIQQFEISTQSTVTLLLSRWPKTRNTGYSATQTQAFSAR